MASSRDIQEIVSKLSSDKAKAREEGIKVLNNWLGGERSFGFCKILSQNTANLQPNEIPHSKTWPFLVTLLIQCIASEISTSKRRPPKLLSAKTFRIAIQRAEDAKFSGRRLLLLPVVKALFSHIWDVLRDVPTFQSEYGIILRYLLTVRDYRFHMRKRVYCSLVLLYMNKVETSMSGKNNIPNPKGCILTLHSLLENPPVDFTDNLREDIVKGFVQIFSHVRDEGKISRKLIECINTYLSKDGPNLGCQSMEIHSAAQEFLLRSWLTTHDRGLKDALILYARLQLKLVRTAAEGSHLVEQLLDVVCKELDQNNMVNTSLPWSDAAKDDKFGNLTSLQFCLMELAAFVFYWACVNMTKQPSSEKRARREDVAACLKEGLMKGKWLWNCAFCFLIRNYHYRISKDLVIYWFEGICESFERILNEGNTNHAYNGVLWVLRSLQELSFVLLPQASVDTLQCSSLTSIKLGTSWHIIWTCLMHVLPIFSNVTSVADAALVLLGNMISNELVNTVIVPQDVWDLRLFKHMPSVYALYFITCYFSRKVSQGDLRDVLHLRKNLLRAVLGLLKWKESLVFNERVVILLPAAMFSLSTGCVPISYYSKGLLMAYSFTDASETADDWFKIEERDHEVLQEISECSVNILSEIELGPRVEASQSHYRHSVRLPRQVTDPLLHEMEDYFLVDVMDKDIGKLLLSDIFYTTSLLSNCIYCLIVTRLRDENSSFLAKMIQNLLKLLEHAVSVIKQNYSDLLHHGCLGSCPILDGTGSTLASLRNFLCCPLFSWRDQNAADSVLCGYTIQATEKLLRALAKLYEVYSECSSNVQLEMVMGNLSSSKSCLQNSNPSDGSEVKIVDMELDVNDDSSDMDHLAFRGKGVSVISSHSSMKWKLDMITAISSFFSVLPSITWKIMFDLMEREKDTKVCDHILCSLCEHFSWSYSHLSDLVASVESMVEMRLSLKLSCNSILKAVHVLLKTLTSSGSVGKDKSVNSSVHGREAEQSLISLGDLINKISTLDILNWPGRVQLIDCICKFIVLDPPIGQVMIEKLLVMLRDPDYRVRLLLARRVGVLFQTWDGHDELFLDICSNFGVKLVMSSKEKLVMEKEVFTAGPQPSPLLETVIVTLAHLAFYSEKIELEAVFMICALAAIDPCLRELVYAVLDSLSTRLRYTTRFKYLEELMGSILFCWVNCNMSLLSLIEIRNLFVSKLEAIDFVQYCCPWLLPALVFGGDTTNLSLLAKVSGQPLRDLAICHFVPIFAVCMALYCSDKKGSEKGAAALQGSLLYIAELTEPERDKLIKKHMVSIVSYILSLASSALKPTIPFFSQDTIVLAIQTVVDGFLETDNHPANICVVDKINIFRPDRVFMFILQMHYKVTEAVHYRHRCHHLSGIHVLINIIGHRVVVPSTSCYLFNLVGQFVRCEPLQEQCCVILSTILEAFKSNTSKDVMNVLGEQLQFFVSKLVACCIPSADNGEPSGFPSQVVSLLNQLIVDSDPLLYGYIKELEPFPDLECFNQIRSFHQDLCKAYCPREHFLKFVSRASDLPERLLSWSLEEMHKKLLTEEVIRPEKNADAVGNFTVWQYEPEIVSAAWSLVRLCGSNNSIKIRQLVSDFISRVGFGDPHLVVFHLPKDISPIPCPQPVSHGSGTKVSPATGSGVSEELLVTLIRLLKKYLLDHPVKIIDIASQALQGILSTNRGQGALLSFGSYERSLIEVHSKGVKMEIVEKFLLDLERKSNDEAISLENSSVWTTHGKTYDTWICPLVYSLIRYSNDMILRLCQDIVLLKAEVAELLLPNVLANLARRKDFSIDLCKLISSQVRENVLIESNDLIKSVQVMLDALNELRLCHVMERASSSSVLLKRESSKNGRPSGYSSRSRSSSEKVKDATSGAMAMPTLLWEKLPPHIEMLVSAVTQINEPDSLYGIIQSHKLTSQIITHEHEGNWSKALEYYDLQVRSAQGVETDGVSNNFSTEPSTSCQLSFPKSDDEDRRRKPFIGLMRSLQQIGCTHILDLYCQGLTSQKGMSHHDPEFSELQYEAAWRAGNWDFSLLNTEASLSPSSQCIKNNHFNENLHSCLRALQEGDFNEFHMRLGDSKQELVLSIYHASKESTQYIYSSIVKLQILDHLGMSWNLRWKSSPSGTIKYHQEKQKIFSESITPTLAELEWLNTNWSCILKQTQLHTNLLEPFIAFRRVLLQVLGCNECTVQHLLQSASILRKGSRYSLAAAALHEFKFLSSGTERQHANSYLCCLGRLEEAKLLRAQGRHEMAINLARYILKHYHLNGEASNIHRLVGKWLAETRSSNSRTILDQYLKRAVELVECNDKSDRRCIARQCQTHFHLAHYTDALFRSYEERLNSNEWQAAMRLRRHNKNELEALIKRLKSSTKGEKIDYSAKIQELQKQLTIDKEEAERLQDDRDNFLSLALEGYKRCLVIGDKYDVRVVFRLVSLWFDLSSRPNVVNGMLSTVKEVQSYKFVPLVYQIASRMGGSKDGQGPHTFQYALVSLVKKMAIDHPYHTLFQLLALANGDRVKDKQRSRNSFVVDMDKKHAAENLLNELSSCHGAILRQMKQMVEIYIKLAELEMKKEDTKREILLPREIRSFRQLELVPVITATFPVDRSCQYPEGSFPHFKGLADSVMIMNGINAPKVVECIGSDGCKYRQLAKSGNDDLRQDAVMEQFFGLVNTFLQNHRDTQQRRLRIRTYKVVPFTPSAGVLEWVDGTIPLGEYLIGSSRSGGAHGCYGIGDWSYMECQGKMINEKDKRAAFHKVCENFRPVMHYFFLERFFRPADWFEKRLSYSRSVAASSMVGYIVGLGDRHSFNILIDQATAEVVHIDLGVAFEQGLMLKTPERVPFRLTRDIIDGMGVTGVEGVFRRCCEETLSVMRANKEALLTIIEVFIHDPLYKWALSPLKALQRQKETDDDIDSSLQESQDVYEGNKDAARALMRVKQKLDGYEEGEMRSVHGQVQQLIQDAIDSERLCQLFPGWGAWL
ncbi:serine/threonine-protein kinase ATM isoform X2 [Macadamia integrifolia]|uniref:serine/threonine-protein kinase ATM isoform X2 n=1 Tax=Macadamia integrifolia TaxID=60698 RepID=UPI001C4E4880|nr:serine/threonine-protein kinase ATM isoform X2 [Macadamia integrifolia]